MSEKNVLSYSGGKDSTAMLCLALERETDNLQVTMADTGNEHQTTYDYVEYVSNWMVNKGLKPIRLIRAEFASRIAAKREYVLTKWAGTQTIRTQVEWSKTKRGGAMYDMFRMQNDGPVCS